MVSKQLKHYGGLFIGGASAEVFGDYGVGPNHVLPTSRTARYSGGLSVFTFLRVRTYLRSGVHGEAVTDEQASELRQLIDDTAALARYALLDGPFVCACP